MAGFRRGIGGREYMRLSDADREYLTRLRDDIGGLRQEVIEYADGL